MAAAAEVNPRSRSEEKWKCPVCFEIPIAAFEAPCHHRMCLDCASRIKLSGDNRPCPLCRVPIPVVEASPATQKALDDDAAAAFPKGWELWGKLKVSPSNHVTAIFDLLAGFASGADAAVCYELVLLRLSKRFASNHSLAPLSLSPFSKLRPVGSGTAQGRG